MLAILLFAALVKLNLATRRPLVPAAIFAGYGLVSGLIKGYPFLPILVGTAINLGFGFLYFSLLKRYEEEGVWWAVLILGIVAYIGLGVVLS